jgi:hypothetical protein
MDEPLAESNMRRWVGMVLLNLIIELLGKAGW